MDASEMILNLVHKAAIKAEVNEKHPSDHENDSSPDQLVKNSQKEERKEATFKVSLATNNQGLESDKENVSRKKIRVEARQICNNREKGEEEKILVLQQLGRSQTRPEGFPAFLCIDGRIADSSGVKRKIPRPANAFMLFANEWRKKLAAENPRESNKDISVRLGILWKNMAKDVKEKYFALAREVDAEHKRKYPARRIEQRAIQVYQALKPKKLTAIIETSECKQQKRRGNLTNRWIIAAETIHLKVSEFELRLIDESTVGRVTRRHDRPPPPKQKHVQFEEGSSLEDQEGSNEESIGDKGVLLYLAQRDGEAELSLPRARFRVGKFPPSSVNPPSSLGAFPSDSSMTKRT